MCISDHTNLKLTAGHIQNLHFSLLDLSFSDFQVCSSPGVNQRTRGLYGAAVFADVSHDPVIPAGSSSAGSTVVSPSSMINQSELCELKVTELLFGLEEEEEERWQVVCQAFSHSHAPFNQAHTWLRSGCSPSAHSEMNLSCSQEQNKQPLSLRITVT